MFVYYCRKCKKDSGTPVCEHCGMPIADPQKNGRIKWQHIRTPLGDTPILLGAFCALLITFMILLLLMFLGELIFSPDKRNAMTMFTQSGILPMAFVLLVTCCAVILLVLGAQGREELHFVLDVKGAHVQTWIVPGRLRCLARAVPYETYNIVPNQEGAQRMLIGETHLLWKDVCRCEFRRHAGRIDLYRPAGFRFMSIYPQREEMNAIEGYIVPLMKQLTRK